MEKVCSALTIPSIRFLTRYVLSIFQITHHNKYKNILADAFIHRKIYVIIFCLGSKAESP